jgi:hypothetical protein
MEHAQAANVFTLTAYADWAESSKPNSNIDQRCRASKTQPGQLSCRLLLVLHFFELSIQHIVLATGAAGIGLRIGSAFSTRLLCIGLLRNGV